jgi:hypothetical protein
VSLLFSSLSLSLSLFCKHSDTLFSFVYAIYS